MNGEIPRSGVIDPAKIYPYDFYYQCSKYGPDCFGKWGIEYFNDETHFSDWKINIKSNQNEYVV